MGKNIRSTGNIFTPSIVFDEYDKICNEYNQSGELNITLNSNTYGQGASIYTNIKTDGSPINLPDEEDDWIERLNNYTGDSAIYSLYIFFDGNYYQYWIDYVTSYDYIPPILDIQDVIVIDNVGLTVTPGTNLTKLGNVGWDSGCASDQKINSGEGWIEFEVKEVDGNTSYGIVIGLSHLNIDAGASNIDFGIYLNNPSVVYKIESGVVTLITGETFIDGDKFRVRVNSGVVTYEKWNGSTWNIIDTSGVTPTYPLLFDCSFNKDGSRNINELTALNVKIAGEDLI